MAEPQIPADWHPATYVVDEPNKVVWRGGSYAVAMGLKGKSATLIPGYTIKLCRAEELVSLRQEIEARAEAKPTWNDLCCGALDWLFKFLRTNGKLLIAGSAGFGAAWGFFKYGSLLGAIGGAITFPSLLCGLITLPGACVAIAWLLWDNFKSLVRWLDRVLNVPD